MNPSKPTEPHQHLNPKLLQSVEKKSKTLAESFAHVTGSLKSSLNAITAVTQEHVSTMQDSAASFDSEIQNAVTQAETYVKRCHSLNEELQKAQRLHGEIKQLRSVVEEMENAYNMLERQEQQIKKRQQQQQQQQQQKSIAMSEL